MYKRPPNPGTCIHVHICIMTVRSHAQVMYEEQVQTLKEELQKRVDSETCSQSSSTQHDRGNLSSEIVELKKTCSVLQQERDALLSAQHVNANSAEMTSLILKENTTLKNQVQPICLYIMNLKLLTYVDEAIGNRDGSSKGEI